MGRCTIHHTYGQGRKTKREEKRRTLGQPRGERATFFFVFFFLTLFFATNCCCCCCCKEEEEEEEETSLKVKKKEEKMVRQRRLSSVCSSVSTLSSVSLSLSLGVSALSTGFAKDGRISPLFYYFYLPPIQVCCFNGSNAMNGIKMRVRNHHRSDDVLLLLLLL